MSGSAQSPSPDDATNPAFHATVDADTIRTAVDLVHALVDECHLHVEPDELRLEAVDPATVAMVDVSLDADAFDSYHADDSHLGVNVARLRDLVGMADRGQQVEFALDPETRKLDVAIGNLDYTLALIDPDAIRSPPGRADLDLPARAIADAADVDRAITAADMVSDHVALGVDPDTDAFYVHADGDTDDVSLDLPADDLVELDAADAHSLFSIDYLGDVNRAMPGGHDTTLRLGEEAPLELAFEFGDGAGSVEYFLAPRIAAR
jgi:proliferating cell nuclear antigen